VHQLKLSYKQVEKYIELCESYGNKTELEKENYLVVKEEDAGPLERWYGEGEEYIVIMPDGEHYHHDQYLIASLSGWLRGFQPRVKGKK
jgi:hypothetical protein